MSRKDRLERKLRKIEEAEEREAKTGMRQSIGAMIAKMAFGFLFISTGFRSPDSGWSFGYFLTCLTLGGALIAWGLLPYLASKKNKDLEAAERMEKILATPLEKFGEQDDYAATLAKKYEKKE